MPESARKIIKKSAVDLVFERMKDLIKTEEWPITEKIPSESDLAEMFEVNRLTVRMALQKLNTIGLVETRAGEGTFVTEFSFMDYIKQASEFYTEEMFADIADFRKAVELECCRLAMDRATPDELEELKRRLDTINGVAASGHDFSRNAYLSIVDADLAFHEYICEISKNALLMLAFSMAREAIYQYLLMIVTKRYQHILDQSPSADNLHNTIYNAILSKDIDACEKAYHDMVNPGEDLHAF